MAGLSGIAIIVAGGLGALWGLSHKNWLIFLLGLGLAFFGIFYVA